MPNSDSARVRAAIAGHDPSIPRATAMAQLARMTQIPDRHLDFASMLHNEQEDPRLRTLAARHLAQIASVPAVQALAAASMVAQPTVLTVVMRMLGAVGDAASVAAADHAAAASRGAAQRQARFAAQLIAHRLHLPGHDVVPPAATALLPLPRATTAVRPLALHTADPAQVAAAIAGITTPVGVELSTRGAAAIDCDGLAWLVLLNQETARPDGIAELATRNAVPAVLMVRGREHTDHRTALYVLSAPSSYGVQLFVFSTAGRLSYAGSGRITRDRLAFSLRAVSDGAHFPVAIEASHDGATLQVTSASIEPSLARSRPQPRPL